jgi:hypothetical protein
MGALTPLDKSLATFFALNVVLKCLKLEEN